MCVPTTPLANCKLLFIGIRNTLKLLTKGIYTVLAFHSIQSKLDHIKRTMHNKKSIERV